MSKIELFDYEKGKYQMLIPSNGGRYIDITYDELIELEKVIKKTLYFSGDVKAYCIENGIALTEDSFGDVLENYYNLREENDGDSEGMTWDECLEEAFDEYPYGDVLTDTVWNKLKTSFDAETSDKECFRALMEELEIEVPEDYSFISNEKWQEIRKAISEMDNYDLVDVFNEWLL